MDAFEKSLNEILVETFNSILKYEESSLRAVMSVPITISEAHMIDTIGKQSETTVSELASLMSIAMPTATVAVKKLERKGFIRKVPCERDGRRTIISLTDLGRKIEKVHHLFHRKMVRNISSQFPEAEKELLLKSIKTLNEYFRVKVEAQV